MSDQRVTGADERNRLMGAEVGLGADRDATVERRDVSAEGSGERSITIGYRPVGLLTQR